MAGLYFEEELLSGDDPNAPGRLLRCWSPSFLSPCLRHKGESLGHAGDHRISQREYSLKYGLLPDDIGARTHAAPWPVPKCITGFANLRSALPMNLKAHYPGFKVLG